MKEIDKKAIAIDGAYDALNYLSNKGYFDKAIFEEGVNDYDKTNYKTNNFKI